MDEEPEGERAADHSVDIRAFLGIGGALGGLASGFFGWLLEPRCHTRLPPVSETKPFSTNKKRLLVTGVIVGAMLVVFPFASAIIGIRNASGVPGGLRGASHIPEMKDKVGIAYRTTSLVALLVPPGVLLGVLCGLTLMTDKRREQAELVRPRGKD
jgi:hypothetical protein